MPASMLPDKVDLIPYGVIDPGRRIIKQIKFLSKYPE